jgi:ankyrin repeat protein
MIRPERLVSPDFRTWDGISGADVWAMIQAAADGDTATIRSMTARQPGLVSAEFEYRTPLRFAVAENHVEIARLLLDLGANPTYESYSDSLLTMAHDRGYQEMETLLVGTLREKWGIVPEGDEIAAVIRNRDIVQLTARLDAQPELLEAADQRGNKPIHWAVMTRQMPTIEALLERGADINARRPDGARPLELTNGDYWYRGWRDVPSTAIQNHWMLVGFLLARGAEYDISTAAKLGDLDRIRTLLDDDPGIVNRLPRYCGYYSGLPLKSAARAGNLEAVKLLLERGANPNGAEPIAAHGGALYDAVAGRHVEIARLLLEHGANPNGMVDSSGSCIWAARNHPELFNLLSSYGGAMTLELASYDGNVPHVATMLQANPALPITEEAVHYATENGHQAVLELMLRHQPQVLESARLGDAPTPELARWILEHGTDVNRTSWLGIAPLHRFAGQGRTDLAAVCVQFGARIDAVDDEFRSTPLGWAARAGKTSMVSWLLERGADPQLPAEWPWARPVEWARRRGHEDVVGLLTDSGPR